MSAVARTGERFGAGHVADVVRGGETEGIERWGHRSLSVYGLLPDRTRRELMSMLDQLVAAGALEVGDHRTLRFGPRGRAVMRAEDEVTLAVPMGARGARRERGRASAAASALTDDERALFERLRALRKRLAGEMGVPPYVVFGDATLRDLCRARPRTPREMLGVKGVGEKKLEQFGDAFLQELAS
jgi:ATP-dependent DNA helicase RecQ